MRQKFIIPLIISVIIIAIGIFGIYTMKQDWMSQNIDVNKPIVSKIKQGDQTPDLKTIIHEAEKSVMKIEGHNEQEKTSGSGFLFNDRGDIITNAHVIKDAEIIYVRTANARTYTAAVVAVGGDTDIAVIRVPELSGQPFLTMESKSSVDIGDEILALGSPHGFQNSATIGIISGVDRNFFVDGFDYENVYQISAQITHGNSGGPLLNRRNGKVIGINSVGTEDGTIGFSIPINVVYDQVNEWADATENDQLDFTFNADLLDKFDPNELKEDSEYLVEYFFEGIKIRDYVNAYALLGSEMQTKSSYSDFREKYIRIVELNYSDLSVEITEGSHSKSTVNVAIEDKLPNEEKTATKKYKYEFIIGFENDQLKILNIIIP